MSDAPVIDYWAWHLHEGDLVRPVPPYVSIPGLRMAARANILTTMDLREKLVVGSITPPKYWQAAYARWRRTYAKWTWANAAWRDARRRLEETRAKAMEIREKTRGGGAEVNWDEARAEYKAAILKSAEAHAAWEKTLEEYGRADSKLTLACANLENADSKWRHSPEWAEVEALHREECPDCPWDGKTIFPKGLP